MRRALLLCLLLCCPVLATNHLTSEWFSTGYKMAADDLYPTAPGGGPTAACSTCTITRNWDGTTAMMFGGRNETVGGVLYLLDSSTITAATNVMVKMSSLTGPGGAIIASVAVSSTNVWDTTTRPIQLFKLNYLQELGLSQAPYDPSEYEERQLPQQAQAPCTVNVNNDCQLNAGITFSSRPIANKYVPDIMVPMEFFAISSFTVTSSSSQAVWMDVYVSPTMPPGTYTGTLTVYEGVAVSSTIPVSLLVYNFTLPNKHNYPMIVDMDAYDINGRISGNNFPPVSCSTCTTTRNRFAQMFHAHGFSATIGDAPDVNTNDYPSAEYAKHLDGTAYSSALGYGNASGANTPDAFYMIGAYGSWANNPNWSSTNATLFCNQVSSWSANMASYSGAVAVYLSDEQPDLTNTEKWATWITTNCVQSGHSIASWATATLPTAVVSAPHLQYPVSTKAMGVSSATWQSYVDGYLATPGKFVWRYNSTVPGGCGVLNLEEDGICQQAAIWSDYRKKVEGHFIWEGTYFYDLDNGGAEPSNATPILTQARTFGYFTSTSTTKGQTGFQYTNGDGILTYPGTDVLFPASNFGVDTPMASWKLKSFRRAINDMDYLALAKNVSPALTDVIVSATIPVPVLWEQQCFSLPDCSYSYGPRSWTNDPNFWELARESLALLITSQPPYKTILNRGYAIDGKYNVR